MIWLHQDGLLLGLAGVAAKGMRLRPRAGGENICNRLPEGGIPDDMLGRWLRPLQRWSTAREASPWGDGSGCSKGYSRSALSNEVSLEPWRCRR